MQLAGAETGRLRLISNPIQVAVVDGEEAQLVYGRLRWVPPKVEVVCKLAAEFYLRQLSSGAQLGAEDIEEEQRRLMVSWSLRKDDGSFSEQVFPFPAIVDESSRLLPKDELLYKALHDADIRQRAVDADQIWRDYETFKLAELPPLPTNEQLEELYEEAKKKSLTTLLLERDYWSVLRALRGMQSRARASAPTSTGGGRR